MNFGGQTPKMCEHSYFTHAQAGRWTVDAAPPEIQHPALLSQLRLQRLVPLNRGRLWGFSKSSLLEFLVASRVKRDVLKEGRRRRRGGGNGRKKAGPVEVEVDAGEGEHAYILEVYSYILEVYVYRSVCIERESGFVLFVPHPLY